MNDSELQSVSISDLSNDALLGQNLLALNNAHAQELSWLEQERLQHLIAEAFLVRRIGNLAAFLLAFDQNANYDSPNYLWFRDRYPRFVYVDRIVVAQSARGHGHARRLYEDLFSRALAAQHDRIFCEVNLVPPNPASDAFHASLGFTEVGKANVGSRTVRYLSREIPVKTRH
jgi:predicted GNAT superfamily acetyltransferase